MVGKEDVFVCKMFNLDENRQKEERNVIIFLSHVIFPGI